MPSQVVAQPAAAPQSQSDGQAFDIEQLDALLAPIALYPDSLLTQLLMASTFPLEVVQAARWVEEPAHKDLKGDALTKALEAQAWDPSVKSLVPFPQVLAQMNANLDWLQQLGYAFAAQQKDVLDSIQRLRRQAQSNGSLQSTPQQVVQEQPAPSGPSTIVIQPAQADTVYVPTYNPNEVYGSWPYASYPPVYLPPPTGYAVGSAILGGLAFGAGVAVAGGLWGWATPNWGRGDVNVNRWNNINVNRQQLNSNVWRAANRPGGVPANLRRPPNGPVGRPIRGTGLPANAIGRQNVNDPRNVIDRPGRQNLGNLTGPNRPNLNPGSQPNLGQQGGAARPMAPNRPLANAARQNQPGTAARPPGAIAGGAATNRPALQRPQGGGAVQRPQGLQRPQGGGGAFGNMNDGRRAQQFGQRGGQSRQIGNGQRGGAGAAARGGGGGARGRRQ